jgi:hypothetical protein
MLYYFSMPRILCYGWNKYTCIMGLYYVIIHKWLRMGTSCYVLRSNSFNYIIKC